jgi:hypothetical protein
LEKNKAFNQFQLSLSKNASYRKGFAKRKSTDLHDLIGLDSRGIKNFFTEARCTVNKKESFRSKNSEAGSEADEQAYKETFGEEFQRSNNHKKSASYAGTFFKEKKKKRKGCYEHNININFTTTSNSGGQH